MLIGKELQELESFSELDKLKLYNNYIIEEICKRFDEIEWYRKSKKLRINLSLSYRNRKTKWFESKPPKVD